MSSSQWLLLVLLSVLWGASFLFVGLAVRELPPITLCLVRVALAALLLLPVLAIVGLRLPATLRDWQPFLVMAVLNNAIPFLLIATGQKLIPAGLASVLNATTPLFAVVLAHLLTDDDKLTVNRLAGVLLGIGGVAILVGPEALGGSQASVLGMACMLGATFFYGLSAVWGRRLRGTPPLVTAAAQLLCSTAILMPVALAVDQPWSLPAPSLVTVLAVVGLAALSTSLAYVVFFRILSVSGPSSVMLVTLLIPISAIALGAVFLAEPIVAREIAGALVIGASLMIIDGRVLRRLSG